MTMKFEQLIELASKCEPDTEAAQLGFQTRLAARIRELRAVESTGIPLFSSWLWRVSWGLVPLVIAGVAWFLVVSQGLSLPAGTDGVFGQLTALVPGDLL